MSSFRDMILVLLSAAALAGTWAAALADPADAGNSTLACFFEENAVECAAQRIDGQLDQMQNAEPTDPGKPAEPPISQVIAETRDVLTQGVGAVKEAFGIDGEPVGEEVAEKDMGDSTDIGEARKKKLGKKKKKALQKILMVAMVLKAKLSLLLQLFSAHLQTKFFAVAVISLILNAARFWLDLKKGPSKVIYYEHAQHQHHYDHEDDHGSEGYWGRSSDDAQDLAYGSHVDGLSES